MEFEFANFYVGTYSFPLVSKSAIFVSLSWVIFVGAKNEK